jgi:endoglucanase
MKLFSVSHLACHLTGLSAITLSLACEGPPRLPAVPQTSGGSPAANAGGGPAANAGGAPSCADPGAPGGANGLPLGGEGNVPEPVGGTVVSRYGHLRLDGTALVSEAGTPIQLRGISSMWLNWENEGYATDLSALVWMRDNWKLEVIRAAMGVDVDGGYVTGGAIGKANMMGQVEKIIQNAVQAGVYVIVDFHSHHANDFLPESSEFFAEIMKKYGDLPNLILEPFNEPLPSHNWITHLRPYHVSVLDVIRQNDPDDHANIVVLGTPSYDQRPDDVIGMEIQDDAVMYAVHFYSCTHGESFRARAQNALSFGLPIFVTEWGATNADGGVNGTPACLDEAGKWLDFLSANRVSWAAWKLDNCGYEKSQNGVEDTSCMFKAETRVQGGFPDSTLNGHGPFVVERMRCQ